MSFLYPLSSPLFHATAHRAALEAAEIRDGMRVLEVATGSGEMFRRLAGANPGGHTVGVDLSPRMARMTRRRARRRFPRARLDCQAADARQMPFDDESFDAVVCCYLFELVPEEDSRATLGEMWRVLRPEGRLTLVCVGEELPLFNGIYRMAGWVAPAFWGRQVAERMAGLMRGAGFRIEGEKRVWHGLYPSWVVVARRG